MADVIITSNGKWVKGDFNGSNRDKIDFEYRPLSSIRTVSLHDTSTTKGTYVCVKFADGGIWTFDYSTSRGYKVQSVDATSITDNASLLTALAALIP